MVEKRVMARHVYDALCNTKTIDTTHSMDLKIDNVIVVDGVQYQERTWVSRDPENEPPVLVERRFFGSKGAWINSCNYDVEWDDPKPIVELSEGVVTTRNKDGEERFWIPCGNCGTLEEFKVCSASWEIGPWDVNDGHFCRDCTEEEDQRLENHT